MSDMQCPAPKISWEVFSAALGCQYQQSTPSKDWLRYQQFDELQTQNSLTETWWNLAESAHV